MMFLWQVWSARNAWVFDKKKVEATILCNRTMNYLGEYEAANMRDADSTTRPVERRTWKAPSQGTYKLNTDASVCDDGVGLGMVVRDWVGDVVMAAAKRIEGLMNATLLKLKR